MALSTSAFSAFKKFYALKALPKSLFGLSLLASSASLSHAQAPTIPDNILEDLVESYCHNPIFNPDSDAYIDLNPELDSQPINYECNEGDSPETRYGLSFIPLMKEDFNKDGITDISLEARSSGPVGGSVYTNSSILYFLLDKHGKVMGEHAILLYAPFSVHIVDYKVKGNKIFYKSEINPRTQDNYQETDSNKSAINFEVLWRDDAPISTHYLNNCALAQSPLEPFFKPQKKINTTTSIDMHEYFQYVEENTIINNMEINSQISGCNQRSIHLYISPTEGHSLPVLASVLDGLIDSTSFTEPLTILLNKSKNSSIKFGEVTPLNAQWSGQIHIDRTSTTPHIIINLQEK